MSENEALGADLALPEPASEPPRPWCRDCGPGYRLGDEGCRHGAYRPAVGDAGICRTCAQPIWWEIGAVGGRERVGWSDRIERGGDSLVCFKAVGYRHVPMGSREEAIYRAGVKAADAGWAEALREALGQRNEALDRLSDRTRAKWEAEDRYAALVDKVSALADEWGGYGHGRYNVHLEERLPCPACDLLADLRALLEADRG